MATLSIKLTNAGLAAVQAASGSSATVVAGVGLSATPFDFAPTLTALPGEFKRLDAVSGVSAAPNVTHLTVYDTSTDVWSATSFGLFLSDGTLLAVYAGSEPVMNKAGVAFGMLACDIAFEADLAANIAFGDAVFFYPPATLTMRGVARIASQTRVDAAADGEDDADTIVTPKTLRARLLAILTGRTITGAGLVTGGGDLSVNRTLTVTEASAAEIDAGTSASTVITPRRLRTVLDNIGSAMDALRGRTVTGGGLVTGGGDLSANRVLTVTEAAAEDITAGTAADKVVTPRRLGPIAMTLEQNGFIRFFGFQIVWGRTSANGNALTPVNFPEPFANQCFAVAGGGSSDGADAKDNWPQVRTSSISRLGFSFQAASDDPVACSYIAVGN